MKLMWTTADRANELFERAEIRHGYRPHDTMILPPSTPSTTNGVPLFMAEYTHYTGRIPYDIYRLFGNGETTVGNPFTDE